MCVCARAALPAGNGVQNWRLGIPRSSGDRHGVQGPVEPRFLVRLVPPDDLPSLPPSSSSGSGGGLAAARRGVPARASEVVRPPEARTARIAQLGLLRRPPSPLGGLAHPAVITGASRLVLGRGPPPRGGGRARGGRDDLAGAGGRELLGGAAPDPRVGQPHSRQRFLEARSKATSSRVEEGITQSGIIHSSTSPFKIRQNLGELFGLEMHFSQ